ncbi:MAG: GNAT family N-acetyltransferase [Deltaproteobacteria bacterium]|nr:GNAT family N-acetyltransferase [Deltaproteobacteria bacterium]
MGLAASPGDHFTAVRSPASLLTERLRLRRPRLSDCAAIFEEYAADPEATRYLAWTPHRSIADTRAFLERQLEIEAAGGERSWMITRRDEDRAIGVIGCIFDAHAVSLGYVLGRQHWNRGYATEGGRAVLAWALALPATRRVWAVCDVDNVASRRVMEKLGMEREGLLRRWSVHPNLSKEPRDCFVYSRIRDAPARR